MVTSWTTIKWLLLTLGTAGMERNPQMYRVWLTSIPTRRRCVLDHHTFLSQS